MKKMISAAFAVVLFAGMANAQSTTLTTATQSETSASKQATIKWESTTHNFGKINQGKPVSFTYHFTNTGNGPLIITNVAPACGCTTGDYTKESIAPGKKGFITLTYNAAAAGTFSKSASVTTNSDAGIITLFFNGEVVAEAQPAATN